jgi:hypothetical protein
LREQVGLDGAEIQEVGAVNYTLLDGAHVEDCILLKDAARALDLDGLSKLESVQRILDWVGRELWRNEDSASGVRFNEPLVPTAYILRRGRGNDIERSAAFIEVLHQVGLEGCMICCPSADHRSMRPWLVGVLSHGQIYLYDLRLGVALPGAGQQPATLKTLLDHPELLTALDGDSSHRYDVAPLDVRHSEIWLAPALSSLSCRMQLLESIWSASNAPRLALNPEELYGHFDKAARGGMPVRFCARQRDGVSPIVALRRFLPPDQGGVDGSHRRERFEHGMAAWKFFPALVERLSPPDREPGRHLRGVFQRQFSAMFLPSASPRDQMLRGYFDEATQALVRERDEINKYGAMIKSDATIGQDFKNWHQEAVDAYAAYYRARAANPVDVGQLKAAEQGIEAAWRRGDQAVMSLLVGSAAQPLSHRCGRLLALCTHEVAELQQSRANRQPKGIAVDARQSSRDAWQAAADWWQAYLEDEYAEHSHSPARIWRARALEALGQRDQAIGLLHELSGITDPIEQLSQLYRARLLQGAVTAR